MSRGHIREEMTGNRTSVRLKDSMVNSLNQKKFLIPFNPNRLVLANHQKKRITQANPQKLQATKKRISKAYLLNCIIGVKNLQVLSLLFLMHLHLHTGGATNVSELPPM